MLIIVFIPLSSASSPTAIALPFGSPKVKGQVSLKSRVAGDDFMDTNIVLTDEKDDGAVQPQVEGEKAAHDRKGSNVFNKFCYSNSFRIFYTRTFLSYWLWWGSATKSAYFVHQCGLENIYVPPTG